MAARIELQRTRVVAGAGHGVTRAGTSRDDGKSACASSGPAVAAPAMDPMLERRVRAGASWFFAIGIFSVVNALIALSHSGAFFLVGLGVNLLIHNLAVNFIIAGIFALFGVFARKAQTWSFIVGILLYALDGLLFLSTGLWLPLLFHGYVLYRICMGLMACHELNAQNR